MEETLQNLIVGQSEAKGSTFGTAPTRNEFYTNYPYFKYWKSDFNTHLTDPEGLIIYIHIPFCVQICDYCFYMREVLKSPKQMSEYIDTLCEEIKLVSNRFNLLHRKVDAIYIGGGTPSLLKEKQFFRIVDTLHKYHQIKDPEFTVEAEPGTFSSKKLEWYKQGGVTRISMGVQSFDDEIIRLSHRKHTGEMALKAVNMVKDVGFYSNIDLLSGLAGESMDTWRKSVDTAVQSGVSMLTIYRMINYSNTTFFDKSVRKDQLALPSDQQEVEFMTHAVQKVQNSGYDSWSSYMFVKDNYKHTYTEKSSRGHDHIAYGASSFGKFGNVVYQNSNIVKLYKEKVANGEVPISRSYALSAKDEMIREILLCTKLFSYTSDEFEVKYGFNYIDLIKDAVVKLEREDYIAIGERGIELTQKGIVFGDYVGMALASSLKNTLALDNISFTY
ncbi:MAG: coproporphyrinogen-III oxidase family protein [Bacteroidota bacterium]